MWHAQGFFAVWFSVFFYGVQGERVSRLYLLRWRVCLLLALLFLVSLPESLEHRAVYSSVFFFYLGSSSALHSRSCMQLRGRWSHRLALGCCFVDVVVGEYNMADIPTGASAVAATKFPMFFVHIRSIRDVGCFPVPKYVMGGGGGVSVVCINQSVYKVVAVQFAGK